MPGNRPRIFAGVILFAAVASAVLGDEKQTPIEKFTAFAANVQRGGSTPIDIVVYRWSTDEEREQLLTTLQEFGRDKLIGALMKIRPVTGYMKTPNTVAYDFYYARNSPQPDGGHHVILATNRRVAFGEAVSSTRSMQYQLTLVELHLDKDGKGEGKMVPAGKISWNNKTKTIEIENYSALPVQLKNVKAVKP